MNLTIRFINMFKVKYLILFTLFATNLVEQPTPYIVIEQGTLTGRVNEDGSIFEYLGIPYATTSSKTRFQPPLPAPSWEGVLKATDDFESCAQKTLAIVTGTEDCLKINVYVPAKSKGPLAVMVYIHGGGFITGSGGKFVFGPEFLVNQDVILVTFNYRLGPLGFICLGIKEAPGNAGLRDQLAALRWVKKNIAAFGGNPDNVTIFGESAGAVSVSILLASEASSGLYNKAIMQSGSSISNFAINRRPIWTASLLAKKLGYESQDPYELYEIFSKASYKDLIKATVDKPLGKYFETKLIYLPCIERQYRDIEPLLTDLPYNLITNKPKNISIIHGTTSQEGLFFIRFDTEATLQKRNERYLFATDLEFKTKSEVETVAGRVKEFYFGDELISMKNIMNVSNYYTHIFFEMPSILESEVYLDKSNSNVFNYYFNYSGYRNLLKTLLGYWNMPGASHADELLYLFNARFWPFWINNEDRKIIDSMTKMWTNFAKYGNPTPSLSSAEELSVNWTPSKKGNLKFLRIEDTIKIDSIPNPSAYKLWKDIYTKHRRKRA